MTVEDRHHVSPGEVLVTQKLLVRLPAAAVGTHVAQARVAAGAREVRLEVALGLVAG